MSPSVCAFRVEKDALTSPTQVAPKTTTVAVGGDEQLVPDHDELRRVRCELKELRESVDQLRGQFERRVRELQAEVDEERSARRQLVSDVERLKKLVTTKRRPF